MRISSLILVFMGCSFLQIHAPAAPVSMATVARTARGMGLCVSAARVTAGFGVTCLPWPLTCPSPPGTSLRAPSRNMLRLPRPPHLRPPLKCSSQPQSPPLLKLRPSWNRGDPNRVRKRWRYCGSISRWAGDVSWWLGPVWKAAPVSGLCCVGVCCRLLMKLNVWAPPEVSLPEWWPCPWSSPRKPLWSKRLSHVPFFLERYLRKKRVVGFQCFYFSFCGIYGYF